jgi:peptidoglycan/LPS O-acetylase OafA/YrhL
MPATWYLSTDTQMFLLAPILIYPAWKFGRRILFLVLPALVLILSLAAYQESMENKILVKDVSL